MEPLPVKHQPEHNQFITQQKPQPDPVIKQQSQVQPVRVWQDLPFFDYFANKTKGKQNLLLMQSKYNKNLQQKLQNQIQEGKTKIAKKKQPIIINQKQVSYEQKFRKQRQQLQRKKQAFKESLSQVLEEQHNFISKNISILRNSRQRSHSNFESINPNWKEEVVSSLRRFKQFQSTIQQKNTALQEKLKKMKLNDQERKTKMIQQIKQKNKKQIIQKQLKYKQFKEQEIQGRKKCEMTVSKLKPQEYKFKQVQQKRIQLLRKAESQRLLQQQTIRKQRMTVRNQDLQAHEKAYLQIINQRKQKWINQFQSFKAQQKSKIRHYSGLYSERVTQQENIMKQQAQKNQERKYEAAHRVKEFSQYVKDRFKPKTTITNNPQRQQYKERHLSLTRFQERSKGIQNLNYIKEKVKNLKTFEQKKQKTVEKTTSLPKLSSKTVYKNYLKQQPSRVKRQMSTKQDFVSVLSKRNDNWLQDAYGYIQKVENKEKTGKGKPLIQTALRKIELLNALY